MRWAQVSINTHLCSSWSPSNASLTSGWSHPCVSWQDAAAASLYDSLYDSLVTADRMQQQPPPRSVSHLGTHFPRLTLTSHQSCSLIGWPPHPWPLIGCSQVPADLWVMQSFLSPNTINSSRTAPFRCMVDQWCTQAKFLFTFLIMYLNHSSLSIGDLQMPW